MTWVGNQIMWALKYKQMGNYNRGFFISHEAMMPLSRCWLEQYLESGELKWRLHLDNTINEPSFRFELLCIRAPERSHSSHAVSRIADHWTPLHHCAIRKDVIGQYTLWILHIQISQVFNSYINSQTNEINNHVQSTIHQFTVNMISTYLELSVYSPGQTLGSLKGDSESSCTNWPMLKEWGWLILNHLSSLSQ